MKLLKYVSKTGLVFLQNKNKILDTLAAKKGEKKASFMASISYPIKREIFSFIWPKRKGLPFMKSEKGKKKNKNKKKKNKKTSFLGKDWGSSLGTEIFYN